MNDGIRMELAAPGTMGLLAGYLADNSLNGYILSKSINRGEWYEVNIKISREKEIIVRLNGEEVLREN